MRDANGVGSGSARCEGRPTPLVTSCSGEKYMLQRKVWRAGLHLKCGGIRKKAFWRPTLASTASTEDVLLKVCDP